MFVGKEIKNFWQLQNAYFTSILEVVEAKNEGTDFIGGIKQNSTSIYCIFTNESKGSK